MNIDPSEFFGIIPIVGNDQSLKITWKWFKPSEKEPPKDRPFLAYVKRSFYDISTGVGNFKWYDCETPIVVEWSKCYEDWETCPRSDYDIKIMKWTEIPEDNDVEKT